MLQISRECDIMCPKHLQDDYLQTKNLRKSCCHAEAWFCCGCGHIFGCTHACGRVLVFVLVRSSLVPTQASRTYLMSFARLVPYKKQLLHADLGVTETIRACFPSHTHTHLDANASKIMHMETHRARNGCDMCENACANLLKFLKHSTMGVHNHE